MEVVNLESVVDGLHSVGPAWEKKSALADEAGCIDPENAADIKAIGAARLLQPTDFGGAQSSIEDHMRAVAVAGEYCLHGNILVSCCLERSWVDACPNAYRRPAGNLVRPDKSHQRVHRA